MKKKNKHFDIAIKSYFLDQPPTFTYPFYIKFENTYILIIDISLNDVLDAINTAINKDISVNILGFEIKRLSTKTINKIKDTDFKDQNLKYKTNCVLQRCAVCHKQSPIFILKSHDDELYLCKRHLRKLYNCLNSMNKAYNLTIKPIDDYNVSVKD